MEFEECETDVGTRSNGLLYKKDIVEEVKGNSGGGEAYNGCWVKGK